MADDLQEQKINLWSANSSSQSLSSLCLVARSATALLCATGSVMQQTHFRAGIGLFANARCAPRFRLKKTKQREEPDLVFKSYILIWIINTLVIDPKNQSVLGVFSAIVSLEAAWRRSESSTRGTAEDFIVCVNNFSTYGGKLSNFPPPTKEKGETRTQDSPHGQQEWSLHVRMHTVRTHAWILWFCAITQPKWASLCLCSSKQETAEEAQTGRSPTCGETAEAPCSLSACAWGWE